MLLELCKAYQQNDKAIMETYSMFVRDTIKVIHPLITVTPGFPFGDKDTCAADIVLRSLSQEWVKKIFIMTPIWYNSPIYIFE